MFRTLSLALVYRFSASSSSDAMPSKQFFYSKTIRFNIDRNSINFVFTFAEEFESSSKNARQKGESEKELLSSSHKAMAPGFFRVQFLLETSSLYIVKPFPLIHSSLGCSVFCPNATVWHYNANGRIVTVSLVKFAHRLQYVFNAVRPSNVANFNCARFVQYIGYANNWFVNLISIRHVSLIIRIHLHIEPIIWNTTKVVVIMILLSLAQRWPTMMLYWQNLELKLPKYDDSQRNWSFHQKIKWFTILTTIIIFCKCALFDMLPSTIETIFSPI